MLDDINILLKKTLEHYSYIYIYIYIYIGYKRHTTTVQMKAYSLLATCYQILCLKLTSGRLGCSLDPGEV